MVSAACKSSLAPPTVPEQYHINAMLSLNIENESWYSGIWIGVLLLRTGLLAFSYPSEVRLRTRMSVCLIFNMLMAVLSFVVAVRLIVLSTKSNFPLVTKSLMASELVNSVVQIPLCMGTAVMAAKIRNILALDN
ncbi:hypothetical protein RvY_17178-1 [Ramazzottius varieornatus]|uniref:Uncharacterized protein n=1 Tax=Ramazzottius varieornatus TaxID=947166 RepID=A0A1D1W252_RAMVA|nr:hypothetical protein RvY_17178-1 [Ramazzottius varieornatus]